MTTEPSSKLNKLLRSQPAGVVLCSSWLADNGYSVDLQQRYKKVGGLNLSARVH